MDIGSKLKNARNEAKFTQEEIAEKLGVSRQTISNWENSKSYPDIISVIKLSDIYSITLDALLKEDENMIKHLDETTNIVKSKNRLRKILPILIFVSIWTFCILFFWIFSGATDAAVFSIFVFWGILPVTSLIISVIIGKDDFRSLTKAGVVALIGIMYMLCEYFTFSLANMVAFDKLNLPNLEALFGGILVSAIGMGIGCLAKYIKDKKSK
ncbi:MAG: helix-turn-helix transcriptional regulator [Ruminococcaceae bacterium]|nr:helix-turn-helix transcriptional regulator [Oscillospiraceae bacterium]